MGAHCLLKPVYKNTDRLHWSNAPNYYITFKSHCRFKFSTSNGLNKRSWNRKKIKCKCVYFKQQNFACASNSQPNSPNKWKNKSKTTHMDYYCVTEIRPVTCRVTATFCWPKRSRIRASRPQDGEKQLECVFALSAVSWRDRVLPCCFHGWPRYSDQCRADHACTRGVKRGVITRGGRGGPMCANNVVNISR